MAVYTVSCVCDTSTLAYFTAWAKSISDAFALFGWVQTGDTGQVVWTATVLTFTQVAVVGAVTTYSYSSYTGPAPRAGMSVIVSGFDTAGNNVNPGVLATVSGGASGTVTMVTSTQANETHAGSGTTTALAAAPGTNTYVYEIWGMGSALQATSPFYLKMEYGTGAWAAGPRIYFTLGTGTNGAGALSGNVGTRIINSGGGGQSTNLYQCYFSGSSDRFGCILWQLAPSSLCRIFCFDRSKDTNGNDTGAYVTHISCGFTQCTQQTVFKVGSGTVTTLETGTANRWATVLPITNTTGVVNDLTHVSPVYPLVGQVDNPSLMAMVGLTADFAEGAVFAAQVYGAYHNYLFTKGEGTPVVGNQAVGYPAIRWE